MTSPIRRWLALTALALVGCAGAAAAIAQHGGGGGGSHGGGGGGFHGGGGGVFHGGGGGGFHGGGGGGFHGGGGGFHVGGAAHVFSGTRGVSGFRDGGYRGGPGFRGGYYGGGRSGYYGGWRGGYYGAGLGWLGYGLTFATLPLYYDTYWWDGVPYYYDDDNYYLWDGNADSYVTVQPPAGLQAQVAAEPSPEADPKFEVFAYPKNGQTAAQQARDVSECRQWATGQVGSDATKHVDYLRAEDACLTGRGYSVR
ncbi:MAG: hypothetical protein WA825_09255 [Steroidobacteraceae bacterium]